ncbi:nitrogen fixation protein NifR [Staphylococcus aureus]|nr:nitrogen fixation protein NifR [Staphylococcus aureus]KZS36116.1 nitrogen fixation protein NifR [Staphylococcus aureus]OZX58759.1 nitrogen fixation protein NifR [Staphylococcus aureus]PHX19619.1 nitrogen fixation protein NifR [Staphylococcus aureus]
MTERKCACNKLFSILVRGPNTEADEKSAYNNVQVGVGRRNKFFENIISVPLPSQTTLYKA